MDLGLQNKVAFISGGSRGIGFAIAHAFAVEGAKVAITGRTDGDLATAQRRLIDACSVDRILSIKADMTVEVEVIRALDQVEAELGPVEFAVTNVGSGSGPAGYELSRDAWQNSLDVNLFSGLLVAGAILPRFVRRESGTLTMISSIAGLEALRAPIPYSVSKAGIIAAMKSYAREVGRFGVRANAVAPGNVLFEGGSWFRKMSEPAGRRITEDYVAKEVALQRFARPEEIADVVVFLASERSSFVTGCVLVADGGQTRFIF